MIYRPKLNKKKRLLSIWQLIIIWSLVTVVGATLLRMNNVKMIKRKEAVLAADESGDAELIQNRLYDLQNYVFKHMNSSTGVFFLEHTYRQRFQQKIDDAKNTIQSSASKEFYRNVANICEKRFSHFSSNYVNCFLQELNSRPVSVDDPIQIKSLDPNLYKHEFISPLWSPDIVGFVVICWLVLSIIIITKLIAWLALRLYLRFKVDFNDVSG